MHLGHKDYHRANDAFTMHITRMLQNAEHVRLSDGAKGLIKNYGAWFIQFPTFTYIRIDGCPVAPYRLPRYPTDHIVLLEIVRQICDFDAIVKKEKHKIGFGGDFPLRIGVAKMCPSIQSAHTTGDELAAYGFSFHSKRMNFDIIGEA